MSDSKVIEISDLEELKSNLAAAGPKLVAIQCSARWCRPCLGIKPQFKKMSVEFDDVVFLSLDVDDASDAAEELSVSAMPAFQFFRENVKVNEFVGASTAKLREMIETLRAGPAAAADPDAGAEPAAAPEEEPKK